MTITLQPIRIRTGSKDTEGRLALADGELLAVFVRLDDEIHGEDRGRWFLETAYDSLQRALPPLFGSLAEAEGMVPRRNTSAFHLTGRKHRR